MAEEDRETSSGWVSFWDLSYGDGSYLEHWDAPEVPEELVELVHSGQFSSGCTVLDIGCGAGREALYLASKGCNVMGLDSSAEALKQAKIRQSRQADGDSLNIDWVQGNALDPQVAPESIDWILDRGCLHCIDHEERSLYAKAVDRLLRPGGSLLLRGARRDDEELGVVGIDSKELDVLFPGDRFERSPLNRFAMRSRAGDLDAIWVRIDKKPEGWAKSRPDTGKCE